MDEYKRWLESPVFDEETRREVSRLTDEKEIHDRFYRTLEFGTGGMRGLVGAGSNRMNIYTVGRATQGLADFLRSQKEGGSVVIAYDSRKFSREFALDSALILAANGIKSYFFQSLRPTPELSFAVRKFKAAAGIVITASHNPPEYNGYKVYFSDGGQIVPPFDGQILDCVNAVDYEDVLRISREEAEKAGLFAEIGAETDEEYLNAVKELSLSPKAREKFAGEIKIVYTPLNGAGNLLVRRVLNELGFSQVFVVPEQEAPDGNFPTLRVPNPEDRGAFEYALRLAQEKDADLILATDPDSDRLGVMVKRREGGYMSFTGNMSGAILAEYLLSRREALGLLPKRREDGALVTTVVSGKLPRAIAKAYGLTVIEVLTGFKYIGRQIRLFEEAAQKCGGLNAESYAYRFEFGFEESYGCLAGTYARDKDAVAAAAILCEAAAYYREQGMTLADQMEHIYRKYGYACESLESRTYAGGEGREKIASLMRRLRENPPKRLGEERVTVVDYSKPLAGRRDPLPLSDVLYFELPNEGWCCVRPSGTEPKIKFYFGAKGDSSKDAQNRMERIKTDLMRFVGEDKT